MAPQDLSRVLRSGQLGEAAGRLEREREAAVSRDDIPRRAAAGNDLGVVYYRMGKIPEARAALEGSRDDFASLNDQVGRARALGNLARVEERSHNRSGALVLYQQAADLMHDANERADEFATLVSLSRLCLKMGGWMQALAAYDRGLSVKPRKGSLDLMLHWLYQIPLKMMGIG